MKLREVIEKTSLKASFLIVALMILSLRAKPFRWKKQRFAQKQICARQIEMFFKREATKVERKY